jgi:hypothetical protein
MQQAGFGGNDFGMIDNISSFGRGEGSTWIGIGTS